MILLLLLHLMTKRRSH